MFSLTSEKRSTFTLDAPNEEIQNSQTSDSLSNSREWKEGHSDQRLSLTVNSSPETKLKFKLELSDWTLEIEISRSNSNYLNSFSLSTWSFKTLSLSPECKADLRL